MGEILVTGAGGNVGSEVVKLLRAKAREVRAPSRLLFDFLRPETFKTAFLGVDKVFLMRPPQLGNARDPLPALEAAKRLGVRHVVFLSLLGTEKSKVVPHLAIEDTIKKIGFIYTFLRPSFFMQNLSTTHAADIRERNEILVPAGSGKTSFIDVRDIAEVAALCLTTSGHENKAYALKGREALSYQEVARFLSAELGRDIVYRSPSIARFVLAMRKRRHPWSFIAVMVAIYTVARLGFAGTITKDVERLLGRPPISFAQFVRDNKSAFFAQDRGTQTTQQCKSTI